MDSLRFGRLNQEFHVVFERCPNAPCRLLATWRAASTRSADVFVQIPSAAPRRSTRALLEPIAA